MVDLIKEIKSKVVIIAEVGCNHNGDMDVAKQLINIAADCGANAVKFQSFVPENMITTHSPKADYQIRATGTGESQYDRLCRMKVSEEDHEMLVEYCRNKNITFFSAPFDETSADLLRKLEVPFFKIPSGEITNLPLIKHVASFGNPMILSTGMANLDEIEDALSVVGDDKKGNIILMHCLSDYPAKWEEANLRAIQTIRDAFHLPVGFSDHTEGIELSLVAVGLGAVIIEKHITLDKNMEGGDHKASLEPHGFKEMVGKIRRLEIALGDGIKKCMPSEENVKKIARKSIVAAKSINKGDVIRKNDLAIKRPGTGIQPKFLSKVINSRAKENISSDQPISWSQLDLENNDYLNTE
jgi:N-acetylneuraminate synthase